MKPLKILTLVACFATPMVAGDAFAEDAAAKAKPSKAQIEAMLTKCSDQADAKGLFVKAGKGAARKAFRRECMSKLGVEPK